VPNVQWKTPDDGQRNFSKHVEFLDKNKSGKFVRLLVLLKRNYIIHCLCSKIAHVIGLVSFNQETYGTRKGTRGY
jgi:hypothetical protein